MLVRESALTQERATEVLNNVCSERKIPGAALGVIVNGEVVVKTVVGTANVGTGLAATDDTLFQAGSVGKSYTATVVMQLVDEGKLDLDRPVKEYISDLELNDPDATRTVTTRHLLTHTSGIDGDRFDDDGAYGRGDDCLAKYTSDLKTLPMITAPGGLWSYCNSGYILLGRLIEVLTGATFESAIKERLLDPLGLKKTFYFPGEVILHSVAVGHMPQGDGEPVVSPVWEFPRVTHPAGGNLSTTIEELLAFAQLHLNGGIAP
ncbi:MAG: serine hydrolase domain-containing protein, partial [Actinomycetota bacterium]